MTTPDDMRGRVSHQPLFYGPRLIRSFAPASWRSPSRSRLGVDGGPAIVATVGLDKVVPGVRRVDRPDEPQLSSKAGRPAVNEASRGPVREIPIADLRRSVDAAVPRALGRTPVRHARDVQLTEPDAVGRGRLSSHELTDSALHLG